ncbi:MAG: 30S ribosomal protein S15, partial [Woeseiaceae bacterium]|nr:30S ribosomal protein S15 [Woeseiaceae bacterium]
MALQPEQKTNLIGDYRTHDSDTGSPEVQVALLS